MARFHGALPRQVLTESLEDFIVPSWKCLTESFGFSLPEASSLFEKQPLILVEGELSEKVEFFRELGVPQDDIVTLAKGSTAADLVVKPLRELRRNAQFATEIMGVSAQELAESATVFLAADFPTVILPRYDFARSVGADSSDLRALVRGTDAEWCRRAVKRDGLDYVKFRAKPEVLRNFMFMLQWYDIY